MGYELKLIIGQEYPWPDHEGLRRTIRHLAEVDLSKPGYGSALWKLFDDPDLDVSRPYSIETAVFNEQENNYEFLTQDPHGKPLIPIDLSLVREALASDWEQSKLEYSSAFGYRRFYIALLLLDGIIQTFPADEFKVDDEVRASNPLAGKLVAMAWRH